MFDALPLGSSSSLPLHSARYEEKGGFDEWQEGGVGLRAEVVPTAVLINQLQTAEMDEAVLREQLHADVLGQPEGGECEAREVCQGANVSEFLQVGRLLVTAFGGKYWMDRKEAALPSARKPFIDVRTLPPPSSVVEYSGKHSSSNFGSCTK